MLDLNTLSESKEVTIVEPSNNIFDRLGNNTYDYKDVISELVDNSISARRKEEILRVDVIVTVNEANEAVRFIIRDNGTGISQDRLGVAISPAGALSLNSLNEHGLGMKQAVAALGKLDYLATKTLGEGQARVIREFRFGNIQTFYADWDAKCGTEISIKDLKPIVSTNASAITATLVPYLGARYRRFLREDNKVVDLFLSIIKENASQASYLWNVAAVKPIYFHPSTRTNKPVLLKHPIKGNGWSAELTFGYAPQSEEEYQELGIDAPNRYHPYNVSLSKQGLDILLHDRVIRFHQLSEVGLVSMRHNDYNAIRGEIDLINGFYTAITKNSIIEDENFLACIERVKEILQGEKPGPSGNPKKYLKLKTYPEQIPEKLLRDRLATWLGNNPVTKHTSVVTEYVVEGVEGYIDILADAEAWELKTNQAKALDVYQLFMYMDIGNIDTGYLIVPSWSTGAQIAVQRVREKHGRQIKLAKLDNFPINHPPTDQERVDYY